MTRYMPWLFAASFAVAAAAASTNAPPLRPRRPAAARAEDALELVLPDMNFRQAPLRTIVDWIREKSIEADPAGVGANLILKDDGGGALGTTPLTIHLRAPTVRRALVLLATTVGLYIRRDSAVIVLERSAAPPPGTGRRAP